MRSTFQYLRLSLTVAVAAVLLASGHSVLAQAVFGEIRGTVTDSTGAAIPDAIVIVTDVAKGTSVTVSSNGSGDFTASHLIPDTYSVKVTASGFKGFQQTGLDLHADTALNVAAVLSVGASDQTVEVSADQVPQLKTDRADVSTIFGSQEIENLPIPDHNFTNLQLLLPGAQQLGWAHAASENPQGSKQIQVDGQAFGGVAFELDGTDNQDPILGIIVVNPNSDSLSEAKITTQNFDAEFGKAVSSVVTAQTKSGSNTLHGTLFDNRQSSANLARDPFTQGPSQLTAANPFPAALKNQFGGSLGGPVLKDKIFLFGDYQGVRQKVGTADLQTVPSAHLIATCLGTAAPFAGGVPGDCDFSEYTAANATSGNPGHVIYNPVTGVAYANSVIPKAQVSQQALALFKLLQPYAPNNVTTANQGLTNNYSGGGTGIFNSNQWDIRGDATLSQSIHAFGRFSRFTDTLTGKTLFGAAGGDGFGLGGYGGSSLGANDSLALGTDVALSSKLVFDVRLGYYRYDISTSKYNAGVPFATNLGIPGENTAAAITSGAPDFSIADLGVSGNAGPGDKGGNNGQGNGAQYGAGLNIDHCNCPLKEKEDQFQVVSNWTRVIGNHSVKFGADLRYARNLRVPSDNDRTGVNNFGTGPTSNSTGGTGLGFATFVLGDVTSYNRYVSVSTNAKEFQKRDFFYVQDTWRASQKLTINAGLRYEIYFPESVNGGGNGALMDLSTGYIHVAGTGGVKSNLDVNNAKNTYNPRLGAAYSINPKTVIRAGYGRSFDLGVFGSVFGHVVTQNIPVLANQSISGTNGYASYAFNLATGPTPYAGVTIPANGLLPNPGYAVNTKARPFTERLPTLDAYNLSVQRAITSKLSITAAYVGNKGSHTLSAGDGNTTNPNESAVFLPAQYSVTGAPLHYDPAGGNCYPAGANCTNPVGASGATSNPTLLQRYYGGKLPACADAAYATPAGLAAGACGWSQGVSYYGNNQDTHFNSIQITLSQAQFHNLTLNANYAYQRATNYNSSYSTWNRPITFGNDDNLRRQQTTIYGTYKLPFGRNQTFGSHVNAIVNQVISGFEVSPVITYQSGLPFTLTYDECGSYLPSDAPCYPNGSASSLKTGAKGVPGQGVTFFTPPSTAGLASGPFTLPGLDTIGTAGRNTAFGPHFFNTDLSAQKNFTFHEKYALQFRTDALNAFNHINYGLPGGSVESGGSIGAGPGVNNSTNPRQLQFTARIQF